MILENMKDGKTIERKIKNRIAYYVCLIVLGIATLVLGSGNVLPMEISEYMSGCYIGIGCGLCGAGIIYIIRNIRLLKNPEMLKEKEIYENDERNHMIGLKTWSYAGYAMFILLYIGILVTSFISETIYSTILVILGVYSLCVCLARLYCKKTM